MCQQIKIDSYYEEVAETPPMPKDLNGDGLIDDGEILSILTYVIHEMYWIEAEKKTALIADIKEQVSTCEKKTITNGSKSDE